MDKTSCLTAGKEENLKQSNKNHEFRTAALCQRHFKMSIFAEMGCRFLQGSIQVLYSLIHHITCRFEARQALIYQLASGLMGENGKYNYSKAVHLYPPFFDIFCSPKNYKTASALTPSTAASAVTIIWTPNPTDSAIKRKFSRRRRKKKVTRTPFFSWTMASQAPL